MKEGDRLARIELLAKGREKLRVNKLLVSETLNIVGTLWDVLQEVHAASRDGWELSDKNEYFPRNMFGTYSVTMVKYKEPEKVVPDPKPIPEVIQKVIEEKGPQEAAARSVLPPEPRKRGPKPKVV